ncbi:MAG TPA: hypothetical protein VG148_08025 [Pyrinomonadaceae bacterium]|nr:hypothetical protein [Pyrinomonadaceae bacterium]
MKFLTKLGQAVLKGIAIVSGVAPAFSQIPGLSGPVQTISQDLSQIAQIIAQVEVIGQQLGHGGPDKLSAAAPLVEQVLLQSSLLANRKIDKNRADLFTQGSKKIADGMADVLNSLHEDEVQSENKTK